MNLNEPKKKPRTRVQYKSPFPIVLSKTEEWVIYTAYLTDAGSCITDPEEIISVHSMGFFGKGSLSRSYPSFGKARYGAPPLVKNRQWIRRQAWLQEVKLLDTEFYQDNKFNENIEESVAKENSNSNESDLSADARKHKGKESISNQKKSEEPDIIEIPVNVPNMSKNSGNAQTINDDICEIIPSSSEDDNICVIINKTSENKYDKSVIRKNEEKSLEDQHIDINNSDNCNSMSTSMHFENKKHDVQGQLLVLPDSDSDTENYLKNVKPRIECESFPVRESLHLTFEETFFLMFGLGCLQLIHFDGTLMSIDSTWLYFCKEDKNFIQKYVVYHYFRSKGWVVKPGLKYGGDFSLYKQGPPFYHASYVVIIDVLDADLLTIIPSKCMRQMTWNTLFGLDRLSETTAKVT